MSNELYLEVDSVWVGTGWPAAIDQPAKILKIETDRICYEYIFEDNCLSETYYKSIYNFLNIFEPIVRDDGELFEDFDL